MLIFQCILGLQSHSIDFTNDFAQANIPSGEPVFIELPRDFKSDGGQHDDVLKLKKILYGQPKPHAYGMKSYEMVCKSAVL